MKAHNPTVDWHTGTYTPDHNTTNIQHHIHVKVTFLYLKEANTLGLFKGQELRSDVIEWLPGKMVLKSFCPQVSGSTHTTQCTGWQSLWQSI